MTVSLTIYIDPVAQQRHRFSSKGRHGHAYEPKKSSEFKESVALEASKQYRGKPIGKKPIEVYFAVYRPNQKGISQKERERREAGLSRPIVKPDTDNYVKSVFDALTGVIWVDDAIIVGFIAQKYYSDYPRIEVIVREIA